MQLATEHTPLTWQLRFDHPSVRVLNYGPLVCLQPRVQSDFASMDRAFHELHEVADVWGEISMGVMLDGSQIGRLAPLALRRINMHLRSLDDRMLCWSVAVLGSTLGARLLRTTLKTGTVLLGTGRQGVFDSVEAAIAFIQDSPGQDPLVANLQPEPLHRFLGFEGRP